MFQKVISRLTKTSCLLLWLVTFNVLEPQRLTSFHANRIKQLAKKKRLINCVSSLVINHTHDRYTASFYKLLTKFFKTAFLKVCLLLSYCCAPAIRQCISAPTKGCLNVCCHTGGRDVFRGPSISPTAMSSA